MNEIHLRVHFFHHLLVLYTYFLVSQIPILKKLGFCSKLFMFVIFIIIQFYLKYIFFFINTLFSLYTQKGKL